MADRVLVAMADLTDEIARIAPYANTDEQGDYKGKISEESE